MEKLKQKLKRHRDKMSFYEKSVKALEKELCIKAAELVLELMDQENPDRNQIINILSECFYLDFVGSTPFIFPNFPEYGIILKHNTIETDDFNEIELKEFPTIVSDYLEFSANETI